MPAMIKGDWTIVLPRGDSLMFSLKNEGERTLSAADGAELAVQTADGRSVVLRRVARAEDNMLRFRIAPEDTRGLREGAYLYDIRVITQADFSDENDLKPGADSDVYSVFAPRLRKFYIGRAADD